MCSSSPGFETRDQRVVQCKSDDEADDVAWPRACAPCVLAVVESVGEGVADAADIGDSDSIVTRPS